MITTTKKPFLTFALVTGIPGVLANDVDTVAYVFKALTTGGLQNVYDAKAVPLPWNDEVLELIHNFQVKNAKKILFFSCLSRKSH